MFMKKFKEFVLKNKQFIISLSILMLGNMFMYWFLKFFQSNPIYIDCYLDDKIPFWGWTVYIYNMFYPFSIVSFFLIYKEDSKTYYKGLISCIIGCLICYIIYLFLPTIMYRPVIPEYDPFTNLVIKITFFFDDPPLNCFPSLHCIFCFQVLFSSIKAKYPVKKKVITAIISILIILSTMLLKQHYIYDVISALLVCIIANTLESTIGIYNLLKLKNEHKKLVKSD